MTSPAPASNHTGRSHPHLWQLACAFAAKRHEGHLRKDGVTPYIAHPFRVAMIVREVFGCADESALCAAILHDTLEDTRTDYDELAERFGVVVADLVAALTKNMALPEAQRETEYDARLARADWRARLVKLGDVYDNWSDKGALSPTSAAKFPEKARRAIALAAPDRARPEIARAIAALESLIAR